MKQQQKSANRLGSASSLLSKANFRANVSLRLLFISTAPPSWKQKPKHHVVQGQPKGAEGDGSAHQPDLPIPAESFPRPSLALREHFAAHRGTHCRFRRVHESGAGRRRGVPRKDEEPENARANHAKRRQHHTHPEH